MAVWNKEDIQLGIAPIGWTNDDMPELGRENTFRQCLSEMALAGFTGTEVGSQYPKEQEALNYDLKLRHMEVCNSWFSSFLLTKPYEEVEQEFVAAVRFLKATGSKVIGVSEQSYSIQGTDAPILEAKYVMNDAEWERLLAGLNRLGAKAQEEGIHLTYHHHMGTVIQTSEETDLFLAGTDAETVSLLFDTGHFAYEGEDVSALLDKYMSRIKHIDLKDIRGKKIEKVRQEHLSFLQGVRLGTFTIPGDGDLDFEQIFEQI